MSDTLEIAAWLSVIILNALSVWDIRRTARRMLEKSEDGQKK